MWAKVAWFVIKSFVGGVLSYIAPRALVALGVPLDQWIVDVFGNLSTEAALWIASAAVFALLFFADRIWHHIQSRRGRPQVEASAAPSRSLDELDRHLSADRAAALRELAALKQVYKVRSFDEIWDATQNLERHLDAVGLDAAGARYFARIRMHFQALKTAQHTKSETKDEVAWRNDEIAYHHPMLAESIRAMDLWLRGRDAPDIFAEAVARLELFKPDDPRQQRFETDPLSPTFQLIRAAEYDKPPIRPILRNLRGNGEGGGP